MKGSAYWLHQVLHVSPKSNVQNGMVLLVTIFRHLVTKRYGHKKGKVK